MNRAYVRVAGRDPLLFRDGRPFSNELGALTARTLRIPLPGTLAGALRSRIGDAAGWDWQKGGPDLARAVTVAGPLLVLNNALLFHAPADALIGKDESEAVRLAPLRPTQPPAGAGCDLPSGLRPLSVIIDAKPESGYEFWSGEDLFRWLANPSGDGLPLPCQHTALSIDSRIHVKIEAERGAAQEGMLFSTESVDFQGGHAFLACVQTDGDSGMSGLWPLGGERRLAYCEAADPVQWPSCPDGLATAVAAARRVRMQLATPACFSGGWRPGWLDSDLVGSPPGLPDVRLQLVAAAVPRREAVSGWDLAARGPKATRWLAPAGSVYYFDVRAGDPSALTGSGWLAPVSDGEHDRIDGYGLALWGVWCERSDEADAR